MRRLSAPTAVACMCAVLLLNACSAANPEARMQSDFSQTRAQQAQYCPSGKMKVCDRRKAVGCKCLSSNHMRAFIRG